MKPNEKLKEIESKFGDQYYSLNEQTSVPAEQDIRWLVNRVKRLTDALEYIETNCGHSQACLQKDWLHCDAGCEFSFIAGKALRNEE